MCRKNVLVFKVPLVLRKQCLCIVRHCQVLMSLHFSISTEKQPSLAGVSKEKIFKTLRILHAPLLGPRKYPIWGKPGHREGCWLGKNFWWPETKRELWHGSFHFLLPFPCLKHKAKPTLTAQRWKQAKRGGMYSGSWLHFNKRERGKNYTCEWGNYGDPEFRIRVINK